MSFSEMLLLLFGDPNGGGKSEGSIEPPSDAVTIGGVVITIDGEEITIQGET